MNIYKTPNSENEITENDSPINNKNRSRSQVGIKFISICLIIGGIVPILMYVYAIVRKPEFRAIMTESLLILAFFIIILAICCFHIYAGFKLWKNNKRYKLIALILFLMQIPIVSSKYLSYSLYTGIQVAIFFGENTPLYKLFFGGEVSFYILNTTMPFYIGINFFAILVALYLLLQIVKDKTGNTTDTLKETHSTKQNSSHLKYNNSDKNALCSESQKKLTKLIQEFSEMGERVAFSLINSSFKEGFIKNIFATYIEFENGNQVIPMEPEFIEIKDIDLDTLSFFCTSERKYKNAKWCDDIQSWKISISNLK